ncbi:MAG: hypothetical protein RSG77_09825 [Hafnia sp.]
MKKLLASLLTLLTLSLAAPAFADQCDPGISSDGELNSGNFSVEDFKQMSQQKQNSKGAVEFCFLGSALKSPEKIFNQQCGGCKEEIKKHCSIKKGKIKAKGVPPAWCAPFAPFL